VFTVLGAVAELERSLICERVRAALRNARAKGRTLGRPQVIVDVALIGRLRAQGKSWRKIARQMGACARTCRRAWQKANLKVCAPLEDKNPTSGAKVSAEGLAASL
jgi:putative DNA-invertase from lambdoid prophage Rac